MTALIVVFITLSLMGSALWIMPSKREREKMSLRMLARKHNITVQLTSIELPDKWDKVTKRESVCAYHKYREKPLKSFSDTNVYPYEVWKHPEVCKNWYASQKFMLSERAISILEKHHDIFVAIEISAVKVSLYWREKGDEETVNEANELIEYLLKLRLG